MGTCIGLDIGYSNVICGYGEAERSFCEVEVRPAQATPLKSLPGGAGLRQGEVVVDVDGEQWVAFAAPGRVQDGRELHEDYTGSQAYNALFKGALLLAAGEDDVIDRLVTGLPVSQALDPECVKRLTERMVGVHQVTGKRSIEVKSVKVVAQPIGTLTEVYCTGNHAEVIEESVVLIIDPGFFSVDWVLFDHREMVRNSSGSSLKAMSVLLDACNEEIAKDYGGIPGVEKIEHALQSGKDSIMLFGKKVIIAEYLEKAADRVIPAVMTEIKKGLRFLNGRAVDCVILGGGGAGIYERFVRGEFPEAQVLNADNSVCSNGVGFWRIAINA